VRQRVLLADKISPAGIQIMEQTGEIDVVLAPNPLEATIAGMVADFDGLIFRMTRIGPEILERGKRLKAVGRHGVGLDTIDVGTATREGICICYTPAANGRSVAEYVMLLLLALSRKLVPADYSERVEREFGKRNQFMGHDVADKVLGIVGMGRIGRQIAKMAGQGFDMKVLGYDPYVPAADLAAICVRKVDSIEELLREADFVSLNCPMTEDLKGFMNFTRISLMKPGAYLINCARGPIVVEEDLARALREGRIAGAALDVFAEEPTPRDYPILDAPNLIATAHIATMTRESMDRMAIDAAKGLVSVLLKNEKPEFLANPEVWSHRRR